MKFATSLVLTASAAQLLLAQPHGHGHHHFHKKHLQTLSAVKRDIATVYVDENGETVPLHKVCEGLAAKKITFKDYEAPDDLCNEPEPAAKSPAQTPEPAPEPEESTSEDVLDTSEGGAFYETEQPDNEEAESAPQDSQGGGDSDSTSDSDSGSDSQPKDDGQGAQSQVSEGEGLDRDFPDGEIDCDNFPSEYGALAVEHLELGGWIGIQQVEIANNQVQDMRTAIAGEGCTDGAMCSYACPAGYLKSQWPSTQGATGQSVGGLECKDGKLRLTNPKLSTKLCIEGTGGVEARNKAGDVVSICRTDYPGTESETIPVALQAGETKELACPEAESYFKWNNQPTSAQYYLNPIGVGPEKACQWGEAGTKMGNWAPINLGVGQRGS